MYEPALHRMPRSGRLERQLCRSHATLLTEARVQCTSSPLLIRVCARLLHESHLDYLTYVCVFVRAISHVLLAASVSVV